MSGPLDIGDLSPRRYFMGIAVALAVVFAFIGGQDDSAASLGVNLVQWSLQSIIPMSLLLLSHRFCAVVPGFQRLGPWMQLFVSGALGALLFVPIALALDVYWFGDEAETFNLSELLDEASSVVVPVTLVWVAINAPFVLGFRFRKQADIASTLATDNSSPDDIAIGPRPAFMSLLPVADPGALIYLQAELHYLAVVTEKGRFLLLYNLRDAISEIADGEGVQVHRSFWVAKEQVASFRRDGRQGLVTMTNGDEVPVARRRLESLEAVVG